MQQELKQKNIALAAPTYLFFDLAYLFSETDGVYWVISDEDIISALPETDYLLVANKKIKRSEKIERKKAEKNAYTVREPVSETVLERVEFVASFCSGLGIYDVYKVIKK